MQWFRDQLGIIRSADEIEQLAAGVDDNGGAYIVPAFSGLFAPYWRSDARGVVTGLTRYVTRAHLARAVLEAANWQTRGVPVIRPVVAETTCLGAAYAAGLATGSGRISTSCAHWRPDQEWTPRMAGAERDREYRSRRKAVERSFGWEEDGA